MKKLLFSAFLMLVFQLSNAQNTDFSSNFIAGGSANLWITTDFQSDVSTQDFRSVNAGIRPYLAKSINQNLTLGLVFEYDFNSIQYDVFSPLPEISTELLKNESQFSAIGVFARTSFNPDNKLKFYLQPELTYGRAIYTEQRGTIFTADRTDKIYAAVLGFGGLYSLNDRFNLLVRLGSVGYNLTERNYNLQDVSERVNSAFASFRPADFSFGIEFKF